MLLGEVPPALTEQARDRTAAAGLRAWVLAVAVVLAPGAAVLGAAAVVAVGGGGNLPAAIPTSLRAVDKAKPLLAKLCCHALFSAYKESRFHEFQ